MRNNRFLNVLIIILISLSITNCIVVKPNITESVNSVKNFHDNDSIVILDSRVPNETYFWREWKWKGKSQNKTLDGVTFDGNSFWYKLNPGIDDGRYSYYEPSNDSLILQGTILNGVQEGRQRFWYESGSLNEYYLAFECEYLNGKKNGYGKYFLYDNLQTKRTFVVEFKNDSIKAVILSDIPEMKDTFKLWYGDAGVLESESYKDNLNGKEDGYYIIFFDKQLISDTALTGAIINGRKNYTFKTWNKSGEIESVREYLNGYLFGFYLDYMYLEDLNEPLVNIHIYRNETRFFDRLTSEW